VLYSWYEGPRFPDLEELGLLFLFSLTLVLSGNVWLIVGLLGFVSGVICALLPRGMQPWKQRLALVAMIHLAFLIYYFAGLPKISTPFDAM
jgi:hypothetical protein